jgi:hypothetical protein
MKSARCIFWVLESRKPGSVSFGKISQIKYQDQDLSLLPPAPKHEKDAAGPVKEKPDGFSEGRYFIPPRANISK